MRTNTNTILVGPSVVLVPYRFVAFHVSVPTAILFKGTDSESVYLLFDSLDAWISEQGVNTSPYVLLLSLCLFILRAFVRAF